MGIEYQLRFEHPGAAAVSDLVRRLPFARERQPPSGEFELRADGPGEGMADAEAHVVPYGLYFRDNGGAGRALLGTLVSRLVSEFGAVTVADEDDVLELPAKVGPAEVSPGTPAATDRRAEKCHIVGAGNTVVPAYLALVRKGYAVRREETSGPLELWRAEGPDCTLIAEDPETLLGLAAMYEVRGPDWAASDAEIETFLAQFPQEDG